MAVDTAEKSERSLGSLWTDQRARAIFFQLLTVIGTVAFIFFIVNNTATNLEQRGIATGFGFLESAAGYDIGQKLVEYTPENTHARAFLVGLLNTLLVAAVGIVLATILGFFLGVMRLSHNWLLSRVVYCYVEVVRNVPLLLQIYFWYAIFLVLPVVKESIELGAGIFINNRGMQVPRPIAEPGFWAIPVALLIGIVAAKAVGIWAKKRQDRTGQAFPTISTGIGIIVGLPLLALVVTGFPVSFDVPELGRFRFTGGLTVFPEFVALLVALTTYTAAFICENVRSGIQAVSHGQTEASHALGIKPSWTMRLIIIPQALRVIVPPLTSQYLNLTKNSSLGVAIGYQEVVATISGTTLNQTGQAIECIAITMAVYLTISLLISAFMNWYNRRIALVER